MIYLTQYALRYIDVDVYTTFIRLYVRFLYVTKLKMLVNRYQYLSEILVWILG